MCYSSVCFEIGRASFRCSSRFEIREIVLIRKTGLFICCASEPGLPCSISLINWEKNTSDSDRGWLGCFGLDLVFGLPELNLVAFVIQNVNKLSIVV